MSSAHCRAIRIKRTAGLQWEPMNGDPLSEFQRDITPYRAAWQSARISGLAVRPEGNWISLGLRVSLSELAPEPFRIARVYDWFAYFDGRCPADQFDRIAEELVHGRYLTIPPAPTQGGSRARVYLNRQVAQTLAGLDEGTFRQNRTPNVQPGPTWYYVGFRKRGFLPTPYGTDRAGFALSANGERSIDVLSYPNQQRVDGKLRTGEPVFDGLEGLIDALLPGFNPRLDAADLQFQVVAPLPFFIYCPDPARMTVRAPAKTPRGGLGLRFFFGPGGLPPSSPFGLRPQDAAESNPGMIEWALDIPWPERSATAKACLFFLDHEIDSFEIKRWPAGASVRAVLDDYFDPARKRLLQGLGMEPYPKKQKDPQRRFEAAIARLMSLLGVPLTWFGDWLAVDQRPDLGGLVEIAGKKIAVLGQCTLLKPEEKFSELHAHADELAAKLGTEAKVLAVVFTSAPTTQSEAHRAAEHQIALVGPDELRQLLDLVKYPEDPESVLGLLQQFRSIASEAIEWPPHFP